MRLENPLEFPLEIEQIIKPKFYGIELLPCLHYRSTGRKLTPESVHVLEMTCGTSAAASGGESFHFQMVMRGLWGRPRLRLRRRRGVSDQTCPLCAEFINFTGRRRCERLSQSR